ASDVTLLPQPDSPTMPSVVPRSIARSTLSTACVVRPLSPRKITRKSAISTSGADVVICALFISCGVLPGQSLGDGGVDYRAIGDPGRIVGGGHERGEMPQTLVADALEPREFGGRILMVVDAQVKLRPFVLAGDAQGGGLLAPLVPAGRFPRHQRC